MLIAIRMKHAICIIKHFLTDVYPTTTPSREHVNVLWNQAFFKKKVLICGRPTSIGTSDLEERVRFRFRTIAVTTPDA